MKNEVKESEKEELYELRKAGIFHFRLFIFSLAMILITILVPAHIKIIPGALSAISILALGISHLNIQYFQKCPNCSTAIRPSVPSCRNCGIGISHKKGDGSEWYR